MHRVVAPEVGRSQDAELIESPQGGPLASKAIRARMPGSLGNSGLVVSRHRSHLAYNYGLLSANCGLLWGIVADYFGLLGVPGRLTSQVESQ